MTAYRLLLRILIAATVVVVLGLLLDSDLAPEVRAIGVCVIGLISYAYWKGWLVPG